MESKTINIVASVNREMQRQKMSMAELARSLRVNPTTVFTMFRRPTLHVHKLIQLSEIFQYNFFREIADKLPYKEPPVKIVGIEVNLEKENIELKQRMKYLEMEVDILRQTLKDLASAKT